MSNQTGWRAGELGSVCNKSRRQSHLSHPDRAERAPRLAVAFSPRLEAPAGHEPILPHRRRAEYHGKPEISPRATVRARSGSHHHRQLIEQPARQLPELHHEQHCRRPQRAELPP